MLHRVSKDKTKRQRTMLDDMKDTGYDPAKAQSDKSGKDTEVQIYTPEYLEAIKEYNASIQMLDSQYSNLTMVNGILAKCFMYEVEVSEAGMITPFNQMIEVNTANGLKHKNVEIPVPYSTKAVIVSVPNTYINLKPGQVVQLKPNSIQNIVVGDPKGGFYVVTKNSFTLIGKHDKQMSNTIENPNFGYVTISYSDVECILEEPINVGQDNTQV